MSLDSDKSSRARDLRIDFFRGLALCMILVDHVQLNPLSKVTYRTFGFSDAAEIFIFLSGLSCGLAYDGVLRRGGWYSVSSVLARRALKLYCYYLGAALLSLVIATDYRSALMQADIDQPLRSLAQSSYQEALDIFDLIQQPPLPSVLILYIVLTLVLVPIFLMAGRRHGASALIGSAVVWMLAQSSPVGLPFFPYFNPLAWQFLFAIGLCFGLRSCRLPPYLDGVGSRWLFRIAWSVVVLGLVFRLAYGGLKLEHITTRWSQAYAEAYDVMKYDLAPLRLVHFLSVAFLVRAYVARDSAFLQGAGRWLVLTGQWALPAFFISAVASTALTVVIASHRFSLVQLVGLNVVAVIGLMLCAAAMSGLSRLWAARMSPDSRLCRSASVRRARSTSEPRRGIW